MPSREAGVDGTGKQFVGGEAVAPAAAGVRMRCGAFREAVAMASAISL